MKKITLPPCLVLVFLLFSAFDAKAQDPSIDGQWSDPIGFGIVPVAVANMPDGRLITWSSRFRDTYTGTGDGLTFTEIFDPTLGTDGQALGEVTANISHDMFCPGINNLPDGRILSAGGTTDEKTSIYNPATGLWTAAPDMNIPRGYQGNVTLADGSVFTLGGSWGGGNNNANNGGKDAEIWTPETGWVVLSGISGDDTYTANDLATEAQGVYRADNHLWLWPASNGKLFHAGPSEMMHWIDTSGNGSMDDAGLRASDGYSMKGTTVMFDVDKILKVGGASSYSSNHPANDRSYVIDISQENNVTVTPTSNSIAFSRTMHNSTVLPNGEVLVTGGLDHAEVFSDTGSRLTAEIYNPGTNSWRQVAGMQTPRTYHSVAILMVDGRVFVGGGGLCDATPGCVNHFDAEIYSPPYLFNGDGSLATRPTISAPSTADYNTSISVTGTSGIQEFSLIRLSSATHSTNNEQRRIPVTFSGDGNYSVDIPQRNLLPPGYYMLFAMDGSGVPSVAETIRIGSAVPLPNSNLVLDLKFDEGSGSVANDDSQYGNDATIYDVDDFGATKVPSTDNWGTGLFGGAFETDGFEFQSNTLADIPYSASLAGIADEVTVMAWVSRDEIVNNVSIFTHVYPNMFFGFHNSLFKWEFDTVTGGRASCYAGYSPPGAWVHIAATYDGQIARLYANGVEVSNRQVTGDIVLEDGLPWSVSGFYEERLDPNPSYNGSGVTDELDGRIDELKVYDLALDENSIIAAFNAGIGLHPTIPDCSTSSIAVEYRIGTSGPWIESNEAQIPDGSELYIRAKDLSAEYFITTPVRNGPTFSSFDDFSQSTGYQVDTQVPQQGDPNRNDGLVGSGNAGWFVFTTAEGCPTIFKLNQGSGGICGPGSTEVITEYQIDGVWQSGESELILNEGTTLVLSGLPNEVNGQPLTKTITLPDGTVVGDNYDLGAITLADQGLYTITSEEGCFKTLNIIITGTCDPGDTPIEPEYRIDGVWSSGASEIQIEVGTDLALSALPNEVNGQPLAVTISLPDGTLVGNNYELGAVTPDDAGVYTITSEQGCSTTLNVVVGDPTCDPDDAVVTPEYRIDGVWQTGETEIALEVGTDLAISGLPNDINGVPLGMSITLPDDTVVGNNYELGAITPADAGLYTITSTQGCSATLNLIVNGPSCDPGDTPIEAEYRINGVWQSGENEITLEVNTALEISGLPNEVNGNPLGYTIILPDGTSVAADHDLGFITEADEGLYTIISEEGCSDTLNVIVAGPSCDPGDTPIVPEYQIDGVWQDGETAITLVEGSTLVLSALPNEVNGDPLAITITLPDGTEVGNNYDLGAVTLADSGRYTMTSFEGCSATLDVTVLTQFCFDFGLTTEYNLNGATAVTGALTVTVQETDDLLLSVLPDGTTYAISGPNGNNKAMDTSDLLLENIVPEDAGTYTFATPEGCEVTLEVIVDGYNCDSLNLETEYSINGESSVLGEMTVTVAERDNLLLSISPDGTTYAISGPNGNDKAMDTSDLLLDNIAPEDAGTYTFATPEGCEVTLEVIVDGYNCDSLNLETEYSINGGSSVLGEMTVTVTERDNLLLSISPDGLAYVISGPNGNDKAMDTSDLLLENISTEDAGTYTFTTSEGCETSLVVTVNSFDCGTLNLQTEYNINGADSVTGADEVNLTEGDELTLRIAPGQIVFSISGPNGNSKALDMSDLNIEAVVPEDSGIYTFTTAEGCELSLEVTVDALGPTSVTMEDIIVYPNPITEGVVRVTLQDFMGESMYVSFYNFEGKNLLVYSIEANHEVEVQLDVAILSSGFYIMEIRRAGNGDTTLKKVIKI